mmetsp:Transcript_23757/g.70894  ORF Transcript_23757/g.70894 Transcript_23757/m.70894 type:complete len:252 (-) Transcript_23757:221-976(-)
MSVRATTPSSLAGKMARMTSMHEMRCVACLLPNSSRMSSSDIPSACLVKIRKSSHLESMFCVSSEERVSPIMSSIARMKVRATELTIRSSMPSVFIRKVTPVSAVSFQMAAFGTRTKTTMTPFQSAGIPVMEILAFSSQAPTCFAVSLSPFLATLTFSSLPASRMLSMASSSSSSSSAIAPPADQAAHQPASALSAPAARGAHRGQRQWKPHLAKSCWRKSPRSRSSLSSRSAVAAVRTLSRKAACFAPSL